MFSKPTLIGHNYRKLDDDEEDDWAGETPPSSPTRTNFLWKRPSDVGDLESAGEHEETKRPEDERFGAPQTAHLIEELGVSSQRISSTREALSLVDHDVRRLLWIELSSVSALRRLIEAAGDEVIGSLRHPIAMRLLTEAVPSFVETVGGWTLWSARMPLTHDHGQLKFLAASRGRILLTVIKQEEDPGVVSDWLRAASLDAAERRRCLALGGSYLTGRLLESLVLKSRHQLDSIDETIAGLAQVCNFDETDVAWRSINRVRFNRTVRMLFEAAQMRTKMTRLHEAYDQALHIGRAAKLRTRGSGDEEDPEMGLWMRQLEFTASGELRRLNHQEKLMQSYVLLARTRHEDDYNRISVLLSLIATIFLPLSFLTGVFGMNFDALPLQHTPWSFLIFCVGCGGIVFAFFALFWYRGWLNVFEHAKHHNNNRRKPLPAPHKNALPRRTRRRRRGPSDDEEEHDAEGNRGAAQIV